MTPLKRCNNNHAKSFSIAFILLLRLMVALEALQSHPAFCDFTLNDISHYARLIGHLKHDILLPQPLDQSDVKMAPKILPSSIVYFLHKALVIPFEFVQVSWDVLKDCFWECKKEPLKKDDYKLFKKFGWEKGISEQLAMRMSPLDFGYLNPLISAAITCHPPSNRCVSDVCPNMKPLKKEKPRKVLVYTLANGVQHAWALHLSCPSKKPFPFIVILSSMFMNY